MRKLVIWAIVLGLVSGMIPAAAQEGAEWTFMVYLAADNDLEDAGLWDFDELEWIGSTDAVNVLVQIDRAAGHDASRGDWTEARRYYMTQDQTLEHIGSTFLSSLGEMNMGSADTLADFVSWAATTYPAKRYALVIWDHGMGWPGVAQDESADGDGLTMPEIAQALEQSQVSSLDVIAFDACLMGQIEVFNAVAPYGLVGVGSPELVPGAGFDYEAILRELTANPTMDAAALGVLMVDSFMYFYQNYDTGNPAFSLAAVDLTQVGGVAQALDELAAAVQATPGAALSHIGDARVNALVYTENYLASDEVEETAAVDLGDFARRLAQRTHIDDVADAAQRVADAVGRMVIHRGQSASLAGSSGVSIYFPRDPKTFEYSRMEYQSGDVRWVNFLETFYGTAAEVISEAPELFITDLFAQEVSIYEPTHIGIDIIGRDIATVSFVLNWERTDGSYVTLDIDHIVSWEEMDGELIAVHDWQDGLNQTSFVWDGETPYVSDGQTEAFALLTVSGDKMDVALARGRFAPAGMEVWTEANLVFDLDSREVTAVYGISNIAGAPPFEIDYKPGDRFQLYWAVLDADGAETYEPGDALTFGEKPLFFDYAPAPSGAYRMGFVVEDIVGTRAYQWTDLQVNNTGLDASLRGYTDFDWGFNFRYPAHWYEPDWDSEEQALFGGPPEDILFTVRPLEGASSAAEAAEQMRQLWTGVAFTSERQATAGAGIPVQIVEYEYLGTDDVLREGIFFTFYRPGIDLGFVFDLDAASAYRTDASAALDVMLRSLRFVDVGTGAALLASGWQTDVNQTLGVSLPVPAAWMPPETNNEWLVYSPVEGDGNTFVALRADPTEGLTNEQVAENWANSIATFEGYANVQITGHREYYIGDATWAAVDFAYTWAEDDTPVTGAFFVITREDWDYVYWMEAPTKNYKVTFVEVFQVMIDGFAFLSNTQPNPMSASASGPFIEIYTASGDSYRPDELTPTENFAADDDINVVFTPAATIEVQLVFVLPDGERVDLAPETFDAGAADLDGLDWEGYGEPWPAGGWAVEVYADGEWVQTLPFTVMPATTEGEVPPAGDGRLDEAYMAAGDGMTADDLVPTAVFSSDDDINVVVLLAPGTGAAEIRAVFTIPDGRSGEDVQPAKPGAPRVLGLDWEAIGEPWPAGEGQVDIYVDEVLVQTLAFTVVP